MRVKKETSSFVTYWGMRAKGRQKRWKYGKERAKVGDMQQLDINASERSAQCIMGSTPTVWAYSSITKGWFNVTSSFLSETKAWNWILKVETVSVCRIQTGSSMKSEPDSWRLCFPFYCHSTAVVSPSRLRCIKQNTVTPSVNSVFNREPINRS